jgi:hypothetical protein
MPSPTIKTLNARIAHRSQLGIFLLWQVNFVAFWVIGLLLGGDALNGMVDGSHYFLADRATLTEVSPMVWYYSFTHAVLTIVTLPVAAYFGLRAWFSRDALRPQTHETRGRGTV